MKPVGGWSEKDIQVLIDKTGASREAVIRFCQAVDRQLYMMLPNHMRRATLHFHLKLNLEEKESSDRNA
ncbi:MAG: hypothetical protein JNN15_09380 [Blastocatellia bacterium]|nr:hypothetical protein [Blastocatellia bacterium]